MNRAFLLKKPPLGFAKLQWKPSVSWDWVCRGVFVLGVTLFCAPLVLQLTPIRWTTSPSLPPGLYWETHEPIVRGAYVHFCVAEDIAAFGAARGYLRTGTCPGMVEELLKVVAATAGDVVELTAQGLTINGQRVPNAPVYQT